MTPADPSLGPLRVQLRDTISGRKCVVVGVGNELRGDDAAGARLAQHLEAAIPSAQTPSSVAPLIFHAGDVPEDYAVRVADQCPEVVLLLDAAAMGLPPGSCRLLAAEDIPPVPGVTHRPSLEMFAAFVRLDCGAQTYLLGIQPHMAHLGMGDEMSPEVEAALEALERMLVEIL